MKNCEIRERVAAYGLENMRESELLALLLGGQEVASTILARFENLRKLAGASLQELQAVHGIGPVKALEIKACFELAKRFHQVHLRPGIILNSSEQVFAYYHEKLRDQKQEKFFVILLDSKHRIIREELVSVGSLNFSVVHPREVFSPAIREAAGSILLVHNHPSGDPVPSREDIQLTYRLIEVGKVVGIDVLDHIVIGDNCYTSFLEQKLCF